MSAFDSSITVNYWNGRGLAEPCRMMMAMSGLNFKDNRCSAPAENLESNLGRMPTVAISNQGSVGQSMAMYYYVASVCGLLGSSPFEAAKCLELAEHLKELKTEWYKMVPYGSEPTEDQLNKWFNEGGSDTTGPAGSRGERFLSWYMGRIEASLTGTNGFAVGWKLSLGDVLMYNTFMEHMTQEESDKPEDTRYPFNSKSRMEQALAKYPKIAASCAKVAENASVIEYLKTRGPQGF